MTHRWFRQACPLVLVAVLAACGPGVTAGPSGAPSGGTPTPTASPTEIPQALIDTAMRFRALTGIQADEAWTRSVAADPRHGDTFGVPLLPEEEAVLDARPRDLGGLAPVLQDYSAAHPGEFGGMYVDPPGGERIIIMFTAHLPDHQAALAKLVHPFASIELRVTPVAEQDLEALMTRISADAAGLRDLGIALVEMSLDTVHRVVDMGISTERLDAAGVLVGRYGPTVVARVIDPTGALLKPRGTVVGRVTDPAGRGLAAMVYGSPLFAEIPMDLLGYETNPADGTFRLERWLPGRWRIAATATGYADGSVEVDVPSGGSATVSIVLVPAGG